MKAPTSEEARPQRRAGLLMEYVIVQPQPGGYWLDPSAYLEILPSLAASLPLGAREFALQPGHYDFTSTTCVKNLGFQSLMIDDAAGSAYMCFRPGVASHDDGLALVYTGLVSVSIDRVEDPGSDGSGPCSSTSCVLIPKGSSTS